MEIDVVKDPDEIRKIIPVIRSAWGMENIEQAVKDTVAAMRFHGGLVLLAKEGDQVVGMSFAFPGLRGGKTYLYSHMTGVISEKKYSGVGEALKLMQKEWALQHGYDLIAWTYDPLMSLNAHFNLHKLGAVARTYLRNFYGQMEDALNFGIPTDRFVAEWWIKKEREPAPADQPTLTIDCTNTSKQPELEDLPDTLYVKIPEDYVSVKRTNHQQALKIRLLSRSVFETLFASGYIATDFERTKAAYLLQKKQSLQQKYGQNIFAAPW